MFPKQSPRQDWFGKYEVQKLLIDGKDQHMLPCQDSVLSVVYLELKDIAVFEYGSHKKRSMGLWKPGENNSLAIEWFPPHTSHLKTSFNVTATQATLSGSLGAHAIEVQLAKVK
jgi:hypothetical protein